MYLIIKKKLHALLHRQKNVGKDWYFSYFILYQYLILFHYYGHCVIFFNFNFFQNLKFKKLLDQFYYVLQGDSGIERILERWKREKEESIET